MRISTEDCTVRPLRQIDVDHVRECCRDWPQREGVRFTAAAARVETDRWVQIHEDDAGHAWVVEAPDGSAVGLVLLRITDRRLHDLFVAVHPGRRGEGWYRAIDSLLWSHYMAGGIVDSGEWEILPDAAAVKGYAQAQGWRSTGRRVGKTGLELDRVEVDRAVHEAAKAVTPRMAKPVAIRE